LAGPQARQAGVNDTLHGNILALYPADPTSRFPRFDGSGGHES
jgi:hypothetical protein